MTVENLLLISLGLNIFFAIIQVILLLLIDSGRQSRINDSPADNQILTFAREKSNTILHRAIKQANKILASAELRGIGLFARQKVKSDKIESDWQERLQVLEKLIAEKFRNDSTAAEKAYSDFIEKIESAISSHVDQNRKLLEEKANKVMEQSQIVLNSFGSEIHEKVKKQLQDELAQAKASIADYKRQRLKVLDENIVEILEHTMRLALGSKLSLNEQSDLIYKALEEAKKEHALE